MTRRIAIASLVLLAGCRTFREAYDPTAFEDWPIDPAKKLDGCVAVVTSPEQDAALWRGRSTDAGRLAPGLEFPLGTIVREAAVRVFGDLFRGGAVRSSGADEVERCRVVLSPRAPEFSWQQRGGGRPEYEVALWVDARLGTGDAVLGRRYASGRFLAAAVPGEVGPSTLGPSVHVTLQALMLKVAADLKAELERREPGSAAAPPGPAPGG
jgi:hypothetical protein